MDQDDANPCRRQPKATSINQSINQCFYSGLSRLLVQHVQQVALSHAKRSTGRKKRMERGLYRPGSRGAHTRTSLHAAATGLPQSVRRQESDHTSTCCPMMMLLRLLVFCVLACSVLAVSDVDDEAQSSLVSRLLGGQPRRGEFRGRGRGRRPRPTPRPRPVVPDVRTASVVDICRWRI